MNHRPPLRLHLVSRVVLRRFTNERGLLTRFRIATRASKEVGVVGFGRTEAVHPAQPVVWEGLWKSIEDRLPDALAAIDAGTVQDSASHQNVLKDCIALHFARSRMVARVHALGVERNRPLLEETIASKDWVDESFRRAHSGLWPAGPEAKRKHAGELIAKALVSIEESSFTADRMVAIFEEVRSIVNAQHLEILVSQDGEFLISDTPAVTLRAGYPGVGPLGGVSLADATTLVMPVGRHHMVALGPAHHLGLVGRQVVDYMNRVQVNSADREIAWHPSASHRDLVVGALNARESPDRD